MTHFAKELEVRNLSIDDNNQLTKEQRRVANFSRLIAAARAAEQAYQEERAESQKRQLDESHERNRAERMLAEMTAKLSEAEMTIARLRQEALIRSMDDLTLGQRQKLLSVAE